MEHNELLDQLIKDTESDEFDNRLDDGFSIATSIATWLRSYKKVYPKPGDVWIVAPEGASEISMTAWRTESQWISPSGWVLSDDVVPIERLYTDE